MRITECFAVLLLISISSGCASFGRLRVGAQAPIAADERARTADVVSEDIRILLGDVEPVARKGEFGIEGGMPDGPMSAEILGNSTAIFFTCWDGRAELSCRSDNASIEDFKNLAGLYKNSTGRHFQTVMQGSVAGSRYEALYAALQSTWRDPVSGIIHGWYHAEILVNQCAEGTGSYASIGYAFSQSDGRSFDKEGIVLTSPSAMQDGSCQGQGLAGPKVVESGEYLYMFFTVDQPGNAAGSGIGVARALKAAPNIWRKFYDGHFDEPGIGGKITPIIVRGDGNGGLWSASVSWNSYLQRYVMLHTDYDREGAIFIRFSRDLLSWSGPSLLMPASSEYGYRYPTLFGQTDDVSLKDGWLYFGRTPKGSRIGPDTLMARRRVTFATLSSTEAQRSLR